MKGGAWALALCLCGGFAAAQKPSSGFEVQEPMRNSQGFRMGDEGEQESLGEKAATHIGSPEFRVRARRSCRSCACGASAAACAIDAEQ